MCLFLQDIRFLMEDIQALKPTIFCGVPRVYDRVYAGKAIMLLVLLPTAINLLYLPYLIML